MYLVLGGGVPSPSGGVYLVGGVPGLGGVPGPGWGVPVPGGAPGQVLPPREQNHTHL